ALVWAIGPRAFETLGRPIFALRERTGRAFVAFLIFSIIIYLPMHLYFGDGNWFEVDGFPLPIQTSRVFLYSGYFFVGVAIGAMGLASGIFAEDGELAARWKTWFGFALAFYGAILFLVYVHHNWVADVSKPPPSWRTAY